MKNTRVTVSTSGLSHVSPRYVDGGKGWWGSRALHAAPVRIALVDWRSIRCNWHLEAYETYKLAQTTLAMNMSTAGSMHRLAFIKHPLKVILSSNHTNLSTARPSSWEVLSRAVADFTANHVRKARLHYFTFFPNNHADTSLSYTLSVNPLSFLPTPTLLNHINMKLITVAIVCFVAGLTQGAALSEQVLSTPT